MPESDEMHLVDFERFIILGINPLSDSRERATIRRMLKPAGGLTTKDCLAVYRNNITSTRARALQVIYPVCKTILGSNYFHPLAREYAWHAADDCADLNVYGGQFAEFIGLQQREDLLRLPYLKELALLEWYWHAAYYAADSAPFNYESFARDAVHPERLRFTLADGLALLKTKYPVREIWQRHRAGENPDGIPALEGCEFLCIHRPGYEPRLTRIDKTMYILLAYIKNGSTLKRLGDSVELNDTLAELLPAVIQQGWVSGFLMYPINR